MRSDVFDVNDRPGRGIYRCVERPSWVVRIDDEWERLPPCFGESRFQDVHYDRIVDLSTTGQVARTDTFVPQILS